MMYKKIPKYRVGSRVRVKKMSQEHYTHYGCLANIGKVGVIKKYEYERYGYYPYHVSFNNSDNLITYLEEELELIVEIGEQLEQQLEFDFMKE